MDLVKLEKIFSSEPAYRLKQAKRAVFVDLISDWSEATILPLALREKLKTSIPPIIKAKIYPAKDSNSHKAVTTLGDGFKIETVLMEHKDNRNTVCISCQVGCSLGCKFCATGGLGFKRDLTSWEIVEQVIFFARFLKQKGEKVTNVVFMGMGEPFLNYDNVMAAIKILNDPEGFGLGVRHISVSTSGIIPGIERFTQENLEVNLALSLHAPNDILRSKLMPINKRYPLQEVLNATLKYIKKTNRRVMFEYIMIKDINDTPELAFELAHLVKPLLGFVNLIPYNATGKFEASTAERIRKFKEILKHEGITVTQRYRFGEDIHGACGQLVYF